VLLTVIPKKKYLQKILKITREKYRKRINGSSNRMQGMNKIWHDKQCNANIPDML
jgi:hypothetical protein